MKQVNLPLSSESRHHKSERVKGVKSSEDKPIRKLGLELTSKMDNRYELSMSFSQQVKYRHAKNTLLLPTDACDRPHLHVL